MVSHNFHQNSSSEERQIIDFDGSQMIFHDEESNKFNKD